MKEQIEMVSACSDAGAGSAACNKVNELKILDHTRDKALKDVCQDMSSSTCKAEIALAQESYDSFDEGISPFEDSAYGKERESINVVLKDPDGSKRQEDQDFVDNLPANATTAIGVGCSVLLAGSCATVAGVGEIGIEVLDYFTGLQKGDLNVDSPLGGKPIIGALSEGVSSEISKLPLPPRTEMLLQGINAGFGVVIDEVVDNEKE